MILADLDQLPKSVSNGPESWSEAFGKAVSATDQVMVTIENVTATQENFRAAYQSYIDEVEQATGVKIDNPMNIELRQGTFEARPNPTYSFNSGGEWIEERSRQAFARFEQQRAALMEQYPAQARLILPDIERRAIRRMQDAERAANEAMASPELGAGGRLAAGLIGGLSGSAKDPYQWVTAVIGGGAGTARTVAGRIGQVMMTEALVSGGTEAVLQAASQERKKRAGLEHGLEDALKNVGIAATFGALFGGTIQGGSEIARIYKLGDGGAELATRVLEGRPEPGDVETLARAMNVELTPDRLDMLSRSFEERVLDEVTIPRDATPAQMKVYEAALRYAEDPDNNLPPDLVERLFADEEAGRLSTLTADQYERAYGGDQNAIDDIADTFFADDLDQAARRVDAAAMRAEDAALRAEEAADAPRAAGIVERPPVLSVAEREALPFAAQGIETDWAAATAAGLVDVIEDMSARGMNARQIADNLGERLNFVAEASRANGEAPFIQKNKEQLVRSVRSKLNVPSMDEQAEFAAWVAQYRNRIAPQAASPVPAARAVESGTIAPSVRFEPLDDRAMRFAEEQAGELRDPEVDADGNYTRVSDLLPFEDGDGNVTLVPISQALEIADEDAFHADLLEACKL